jgi:energy-coupling factor transporter ATP-binding protein EcfA2
VKPVDGLLEATAVLEVAPEPPVLELRDVSASYGRFRALFGVSLSVPAGSVTALVGPNGAGKSTIARVVTGLVPVTKGRIFFSGQDVTGLPTWKLVRLGVAHAPEGRSRTISGSLSSALSAAKALLKRWDAPSSVFRGSPIGGASSRERSRGASNACSRSPASWPSRPSCSSSTSSRSGSHRG